MVLEEDTTLYEQLHKLIMPITNSEQELENLLKLLWHTRKTGLSPSQKSSLQPLFKLSSPNDLDPVLASLRSLIRNCVKKSLDGDDILKLLPPDLPLELKSMLLMLLQKYQHQWKGELSQEQSLLGRSRYSHLLNSGPSAPVLPFTSQEATSSSLPPQIDPTPHLNGHTCGVPAPIAAERNGLCFPQLPLQNDAVPPNILGVLPRLKSMTWSVENKSDMSSNRVAIITLKLQDYTKCPSNEMEVKFQLTRDTLEAVLRSMTYISEQLSRSVGSSSAPLKKKQRH